MSNGWKSTGKTELLTDFTSRFGRPFSATLVLKDTGRHGFEFPPRKRAGEDENGNGNAAEAAAAAPAAPKKRPRAKKAAPVEAPASAAKPARKKAPRKKKAARTKSAAAED